MNLIRTISEPIFFLPLMSVLSGIQLFFTKSFNPFYNKKFEVRRPRIYLVAISFLVAALVQAILLRNSENFSWKEGAYYLLPLIIPMLTIYFLRQPALNPNEWSNPKMMRWTKVSIIINVSLLVLMLILGILFFSYTAVPMPAPIQ
jgi:peptidoglycan/LPS O-acetylase OafA/YrhL